jgi:hypothetical protein
VRELWFPKCIGCGEELFSAPTKGDVVACKCGVVAECVDWHGKQWKVLEDRGKQHGGRVEGVARAPGR